MCINSFFFLLSLALSFSCLYLCAYCVSGLTARLNTFLGLRSVGRKGYVFKIEVFCEIVYFFGLDVYRSKPIFCPKIALKGKTCSRLLLSAKSNCKTPKVAKNWPGLPVWAIIGSSPAFPGPLSLYLFNLQY